MLGRAPAVVGGAARTLGYVGAPGDVGLNEYVANVTALLVSALNRKLLLVRPKYNP
jgi:hypothetical protein